MTPDYHLCSGDVREKPSETGSSTLRKQDSEPAFTDPGEVLLLEDPTPYLPEMWGNQSINSNCNAVVNIHDVFSSTGP